MLILCGTFYVSLPLIQLILVFMVTRKTHHVVPSPDGGWSVKKGGADRASKHFEKKDDAVHWGRQASQKSGSELYVHKKDGTIQKKDSHGNDACPPKDK